MMSETNGQVHPKEYVCENVEDLLRVKMYELFLMFFRQKTKNLKCPLLLCGCADIHYGCSGLRAPYFILHMIAFFPFHIFHTSHISFMMIHISHFIFLTFIHQHSLVTIHQTTISFHNPQEKYVWGTLCNISYSIRTFSITFRIWISFK